MRCGAGDSFDFRPDRPGQPKAWLKNIPRPVITAGFRNYTLRKCPARRPPEIYTYVSRVYQRVKARPAIVSTRYSLYDHFIYSHIINARPMLIPIKNERILPGYPRATSINNFCNAMHVALGFITIIIALRLIMYNKAFH